MKWLIYLHLHVATSINPDSYQTIKTKEVPFKNIQLSPLPFIYSEFQYTSDVDNDPVEQISSKKTFPVIDASLLKESNKLVNLAKKTQATKYYEQALALTPKNVNALVAYGEFLESQNRPFQAGEMYYRALSITPFDDHLKMCHERVYQLALMANYDKYLQMDNRVAVLQ